MIGQLLDGRYRIIEVLSSGAFGQTYLATDMHRPGNPQCVVKQLQPPSNNPQLLKTAQRLFNKEAETLEKLGKHEQIPQLLAYFQENQQFYLVQEFVPGHPLIQEIIPGQPLPEAKVISILQEVLEILEFVHGEGVIHRDINPSNIIRRKPDGKLVLIDFGSVKEVRTPLGNSQGQMLRTIAAGTPAYMPIEQFQGNPQFNSDIYATGMIGIQALTGLPAGELPKLQDSQNANTGNILWRQRAQVSPQLADIIDKMVHYYYGHRYQSVTQVLADLKKISQRFEATSTPPTHSILNPSALLPFLQRYTTGKAPLLILGGLLGIVLLSGLIWLFQRPNQTKAEAFHMQGIEKQKRGNLKGAIAEFDQAVRLNPTSAETYYKRGNAYYDLKDYESALKDYTKAIQLDSQNMNAYFNRGLTRYDMGDQRGAIEDFTHVLALQPNDVEAHYKRGYANYELGIYQAAIDDYTAVIQLKPKESESYHSRGLAYSAFGDKQKAIEDFTQAIRLNPKDSKAYYSRGRARFHLGDYQGAIQDYTQVIQLAPRDADAYINRCSTHLNLTKFREAIEDCTQAIQLDPRKGKAYDNRCVAYFQMNQLRPALEDCSQAIELNPNNPKAYSNLGLVRSAAGDKQGAIESFSQAIELNPSDAVGYSNRGTAYYELGNSERAIEDYTQAIRLNPNFAAAYYNRGKVRVQLGDKQGAIEDFQKAAKLYLDQGRAGSYKDVQNKIRQLQQ